ncbi:hypothetical protein M752DRAFT_266816 [Aspergillus phoenicis ATCC 13157]|uniref:Uncharacterized protein n=1 Tax=Aspergillus phoenicis ATCC 13157 TaxID=1353007 RepID=A0A370PIZ5_ASPPH|nr:hypothetical protein M752DRAFT_266816 [Aspergillus phoenicis ATCC 13157]
MSMTYDALSAMLRLFNAIVALAAGSPFLTGALYGKLPHGAAQIFPFAAPMPGVATLDELSRTVTIQPLLCRGRSRSLAYLQCRMKHVPAPPCHQSESIVALQHSGHIILKWPTWITDIRCLCIRGQLNVIDLPSSETERGLTLLQVHITRSMSKQNEEAIVHAERDPGVLWTLSCIDTKVCRTILERSKTAKVYPPPKPKTPVISC